MPRTQTQGVAPGSTIVSPTLSSPTIAGAVTQTGASGVTYPAARGGIPFIGLSSGSISAAGAISGITALPIAYPNAYCYIPANILATVHAGGWAYCTFSTTTAGTAFLDMYTSGVPVIPSSPAAVTDGKGAFTGDTTERVGPSITVTGGAMGVNGALETYLTAEATSNANAKTIRARLNGAGGAIFISLNMASSVSGKAIGHVFNRGSASVQMGEAIGATGTAGAAHTVPVAGTVNTASNFTVDFTIQKGTATDNLVLGGWKVIVIS